MESYSRGPAAPISEFTIDQAFRAAVERGGSREALVSCHQGLRYSWNELEIEVERTARALAGLGLAPQARIGIWSPNCVEWTLLHLAAARAGLVVVNINPAYRSHELAYVLDKSHIEAIFLPDSDERSNYREILAQAEAPGLPLQHRIYLGTGSWPDFLTAGRDYPASATVSGDVANIQYTSGTTGNPKGVLLTHRNVVNNGRFIAQRVKVTGEDRIAVPVPMYHCFGCVIGTMVWLATSCAMVFPGPRFHALPTMQAISRERCTLLYGVPTMFIGQLNHPDFGDYDFSSLRGGIMAGAPCPVEIMKRVMREMNCRDLTIVYGQTESSPVITGSHADDSVEQRASTVGCALPNTEVKLVHTERRETVLVGEIGELCTRGYLVMKGYDGDDEATRRAVDDEGWLHTGDLAVMHEDGYYHLTGRKNDVIIRGGENVYPKEVEGYLYQHPKVAAAEVVGVPDLRFGEVVAAWIIPRPGVEVTEQEIRAFCEANIAHFKVPTYVRFVDSFPTTVTGKTQKFLMREREIEWRGLAEAARQVTA